jgi:signal transduction histidine kinase
MSSKRDVREIIEAHKGIIFESGEKDKGARFITK